MDARAARQALESVGLVAKHAIEEIVGGWASWTFDVDGAWIVRFPRTEEVAAAITRELALLPQLAATLSFPVPEPTHVGRWAGRPFFAYRRIPGEGLREDDVTPDVLGRIGSMLAELHAFPVERAAVLLGAGPSVAAWRGRFEQLWPIVADVVLPELEDDLAQRVTREFASFVERCDRLPCVLVHNDLGFEHILVDGPDRTPSGLIDFESAWIGDPVIDFVPLRARLGEDAFQRVVDGRDLGDDVEQRMRFYRWMGSVHAIIYGVTAGVDVERTNGVRELQRRINAPV